MNANEILDEMEKLYPNAECELKHETPFQLLVAVVLSAQTTDESVNKVTPALFAAYPTSKAMAQASLSDIESYIRRIGLYRNKARSILKLSQDLEEKFHGEVPSSYKDLMSLAGVGRKTANVVRSVAFDIPSFAVDTHVDRISKRLGLAKIDRDRWNRGHHEFIFFGRYLCHSRNPECYRCPFIDICKKDKVDAYLKKKA